MVARSRSAIAACTFCSLLGFEVLALLGLASIAACFTPKNLVENITDAGLDADSDEGPEIVSACEPSHPSIDTPPGPAAPDAYDASAFVVDEAAGTALDKRTGLEWVRSPNEPLPFREAQCRCARINAGGHRDWRLASRYELFGILDLSKNSIETDGIQLDTRVFLALGPEYYWTSTRAGSSSSATPFKPVVVAIGLGETGEHSGDEDYLYHGSWCVRAGPKAPPERRFIVAAETVTDVITGYTWQRNVDARKWPLAYSLEIETYCAGLVLDGKSSFRVPTVKELHTLVVAGKAAPSIDENAFPDTPPYEFLTSTKFLTSTFWIVGFEGGFIDLNNGRITHKSVRCVRTQ